MGSPKPEQNIPPELEIEALLEELLKTQIALSSSVASTSQFLRFVLTLANENLAVIQSQLKKIEELSNTINDCTPPC